MFLIRPQERDGRNIGSSPDTACKGVASNKFCQEDRCLIIHIALCCLRLLKSSFELPPREDPVPVSFFRLNFSQYPLVRFDEFIDRRVDYSMHALRFHSSRFKNVGILENKFSIGHVS